MSGHSTAAQSATKATVPMSVGPTMAGAGGKAGGGCACCASRGESSHGVARASGAESDSDVVGAGAGEGEGTQHAARAERRRPRSPARPRAWRREAGSGRAAREARMRARPRRRRAALIFGSMPRRTGLGGRAGPRHCGRRRLRGRGGRRGSRWPRSSTQALKPGCRRATWRATPPVAVTAMPPTLLTGATPRRRLMINLAELGYEPSSMELATYDWRLGFPLMEQRDGFLSKLKVRVERLHARHGEKVSVLSHSMGSSLFFYFMAWSESLEPGWCEAHVHSWSNIGGPLLGMPMAVAALLSGETKDTSMMLQLNHLMDLTSFSRERRGALFRSWHALVGLLPKGGAPVWGDGVTAPDGDAFANLLEFIPLPSSSVADRQCDAEGEGGAALTND